MAEDEDGEEYISISKKIEKTQLIQLLSREDLEKVQKQGLGTQIACNKGAVEEMDQWLSNSYEVADYPVSGSFVKGDIRFATGSEPQREEAFTSYLLESTRDDDLALEIEIYNTGEIEASATIYFDFSDIEEMWPSTAS